MCKSDNGPPLDRSFEGQLAVVTGGARGLGYAISERLATSGAHVHILDRDAQGLDTALAKLAEKGVTASGDAIDVTREGDILAAANGLVSGFGTPHILVNNAGWFPFADIMSVSAEEWDTVFSVNAKSVFLCTRAFGRFMLEAQYGRIVSIVSAGAYGPNPTLPHYAAAKAALISLIRTFSVEFAPHGVLVNGLSPGNVATEGSKDAPWLVERIPRIPLRRAGQPEEIAEIVAFLSSEKNRYIVGETIIASGGYIMA